MEQSLKIPFLELEPHHCRYMEGEDGTYCGHPVEGDSSWCSRHAKLVWLPPRERFGRVSK